MSLGDLRDVSPACALNACAARVSNPRVVYYNEFDPKAAAWLRELIRRGLLPPGDVDERSICDVRSTDLAGYDACHFFAGIGGWPLALRLADWPDDRPVWTGSCPCQPFSVAGKGRGHTDERHLWPEFFRLIRERRPDVVFGEQVAGAVGHGWLDGVSADLEGEGYAVGAVVLGAHSIGAPHIRQRLYWVADAECRTAKRRGHDVGGATGCVAGRAQERERIRVDAGAGLDAGGLADPPQRGLRADGGEPGGAGYAEQSEQVGWVGYADQSGRETRDNVTRGVDQGPECASQSGSLGGVGNTDNPRPQGWVKRRDCTGERSTGPDGVGGWADSRWHLCRDGKLRRVPTEPVFQFTSDGISDIMGPSWNLFLHEIHEKVIHHAKKTKVRPGEVLRALWLHYAEETIRGGKHLGRHDAISGAPVLLVALCELTRNLGDVVNGAAQGFRKIQEATMRALWWDARPRSPHQRGLAGPPTGESGDALHSLSPEQSASACCAGLFDLRGQKQGAVALPEALSALEEVWRSVEDGGAKTGRSSRFRGGVGILVGVNAFPLAGAMPGRATLLKGAGNAIVPPLAAEFVRAYLDVTAL